MNEQGYCEYSLNGGTTNETLDAYNSVPSWLFTKTKALSDGNYVLNAYCNDTAGNRNDTTSVSFTMYTAPPASGGGSLPPSPSVTQTSTISSISSGGSVSVSVQSPKIDIRNITLSAKNNITNASLTVSEVQNTSAANFAVRIPFGTIYQAFHINTSINNADLNNVSMEFRVEKKWLTQNNRTYNDVILYRIPSTDSTWQALATSSIKEDAKYYYFLAISPGFSTFVILVSSVGAVECIPDEKRCFNKDIQVCSDSRTWVTTQQCESSCLNAKCVQNFLGINIPIFYYGGIIAVSSAIIIILFLMFKKIRKR